MRITSIIILVFLSQIVLAQKNDYNLIITINKKFEIGNIRLCKIWLLDQNKEIDTVVSCSYSPGELIIQDSTIDLTSIDRVILLIDYVWSKGRKNKVWTAYHYEILLYGSNFDHTFLILKIYNLDEPKFRHIFFPIEGKNYNYEFVICGTAGRLIQKARFSPWWCE